ncbi:MAG: hypothetical protein U0905_08530 [Pirellulales bacterium]
MYAMAGVHLPILWFTNMALGHVQSEPHASTSSHADPSSSSSQPAVTIAISKQKGANAVRVAENVIREAERLQGEVLPDNMQPVVTRNSGSHC